MRLNRIVALNICFTNNFTKQIKDKTQNTLTNIIMTSKNKQTSPLLTADSFFIMNRTTELLMETPLYQKAVSENTELKEKIRYLQYTIMYLEMKNKSLQKKLKIVKKPQTKDEVVIVEIKKEPVEVIHVDEDESNVDQAPIKYEVIETVKPEDIKGVEEEKEEEEVVDQEEEEVVDQEEEEVVDQEEEEVVDQEEEEVVDQEEEAGEEEEEDAVDQEEVVDQEEEDQEEEVVEEEDQDAEEEEEVIVDVDQEEEEEAGVYEIVIKGKTYYVSNETDSFIYKEDENGEISMEVGKYVDGKPTFYKK